MINLLIRHKIRNFKHWKEIFDSALQFRKDGGEKSFQLFHDTEDPEMLTMLFEWESIEKAEEFVKSERLKKEMEQAGVTSAPEIHYLLEIRAMRRTAAD